jgi:tetratricopeptide (TPR) repeat protein/tRNA A-37 threonylcarbamoyl transferase component Bud32
VGGRASASALVPSASPAPVVFGKYQLLESIARGGMAEVFKAKAHGVEGFEKILVIKRILPELSRNPQFVEMFINEAKIAVTLSHANIVQVFDLGRADETYFIAMEYVAGLDLATLLRRGKRHARPIPQELAVYVISELAKGLDYAHRRRDAQQRPLGIVHRDVSPQNVLLSWEGEVKLTDFGIAKARTTVADETEAGTVKGKYAYMAPEQAAGREIDARADLFATGVVLYEALTGISPFQAQSAYDTLERVRKGIYRPLEDVLPAVPEDLAAIVRRALAYAPDERHPNASRLYEDLLQFLYASGRRVGAHDLAEYIAEVRALEEAGMRRADDGRLRAAFDGAEDGAAVRGADATPVQVPSGRSAARRGATGSGARPSAATGTSRPAAERRDVTLLLLSMEDSDRLDDALLARVFARYGAVRWERAEAPSPGKRERAAIFGARDPDGRDTDAAARCALRAVRASVQANGAHGVSGSSVHAAVAAGRVLVTLDGEPVVDERLAQLVDAARALVAASPPATVAATDASAKLLRPRFVLQASAAQGGGELVVAEKAAAESQGKFVGRRDELRRVGELLALANRGRLVVLALSGDAGAGKSRLLAETVRRLRLGQHDVGVHIATCRPHGRTVPLAGMQEMIATILGADELDSPAVLREKVARLRELGLTPHELDAVGTLVGLRQGAEQRGAERPLRSAFLRIATRLAQDRLTIFAWDAVESMDDESQAFLDALLRGAGDSRIAVVLSYRTGFAHGWSELERYHHVPVGGLPDDDVARLIASRLGAEEVPYELLRDVIAKSGGNPLYVEELLKALADAQAVTVADGRVTYRRDVAEVDVPKTLRGLVAARVARLGPLQRHVLQIASIIGGAFTAEVVARVAGESLTDVGAALGVLERRGLVVPVGATEHAFASDLVAEVIAEGLTLDARRDLHRATAEALEAVFPARLDELAERLAHHWREAGDRSRAVAYLVRAADRLETEHALGAAIGTLEKAAALVAATGGADRERLLELYRRMGDLAFRGRDLLRGAELMSAAIEIAEGLLRDEHVARFSVMRGRLLGNATRFDEARQWIERGRALARRLGDRELLRDAALAEAEALAKNGEQRRAAAALEEALAISRELGDRSATIRCLIPLALAQAQAGNAEASASAIAEARALAGDRPDRFTEVELAKMQSLVCFYTSDHQGTVDHATRALELAKEYGFDYEIAVNAHNLGEAYLRLGDSKRSFASLRYSYEVARDHGWTKLQWVNLRVLGFIDATRFGSAEGKQRIIEAVEYAQRHGFVWDVIEGKAMLAIVAQREGDVDEARRQLGEVLRLAAESGHARAVEHAQRALAGLDAGDPIPLPG